VATIDAVIRGVLIACAIGLVACGGHAVIAPKTADAVGNDAAGTGGPATIASNVPDGDWLQFNDNAQRTGVGPAATGITAANVGHLRPQIVHLPGTVDASVIALHNVTVDGRARDLLIMTTTYGRTLALDAATGRQLWEFAPSDINSYQGSPQITTATPTADPDRQYVYATSPDGVVHKLSIATGRQVWARKITFDPTHEKLASPPTVSGSELIVVTDGYNGDAPPYQGHVVTLSLATGRIEHVWNTLCSNRHRLIVPRTCPASDSAIWGRAGAVLVPGSGDILVATGNGPFNGRTNWGDSVLELAPDASRLLHNYTPRDQAQLNTDDLDLGSTSPALLPNPGGPPLAVQGGKDGLLKLLNLNRLDGTRGPAGPRTGGQLQAIRTPGSDMMFTASAVWVHGGRTWLFVGDNSGTSAYVLHSGAHPRLSVRWQSSEPGTSPVIAGGLLYVYNPNGNLDVYKPTSGHMVAQFGVPGGHWNSPIVIGGRIVLPVGDANNFDTSGELYIWRL
jgi:outer membrane protein assembly factor BamB